MRQGIMIALVCLCITAIFSCKNNKTNVKKSIPKFLLGYWVPKEIKWGGDDMNSKDTGDVFRTAFFYTLCFDTANRFTFFASTQRHPKDNNDSIIFAGEPIVKGFEGNWNFNDTMLDVSYKLIATGSTPADSTEKHERIKILYYSKGTLLLFKNELYERTIKYDRISQQTIEAYKKEYSK